MSMVQQGEQNQNTTSEKVILGRITGVYGVKGWLKVFSYTDPMEAIVDYRPWYLRPQSAVSTTTIKPGMHSADNSHWTKVELEAGKRHAKTVVVKLEHCEDRDQAMFYVGKEIAIDKQQLEQLRHKDEYYWRDLIGLRVINQQNIELGVVKSLMETGANDVLVVVSEAEASETGDSKESSKASIIERLIPWTMDNAVIAVDLQQGIIEVDWDADF